jgi:hypothetical protein
MLSGRPIVDDVEGDGKKRRTVGRGRKSADDDVADLALRKGGEQAAEVRHWRGRSRDSLTASAKRANRSR